MSNAVSQMSLFGRDEVSFDGAFARIERVELADGAWLEVARGWLSGHARVFEDLRRALRWRSDKRVMYEREVEVPRLYATLPESGAAKLGVPIVEAMRDALAAHYGEPLVRTSFALYRDGKDSVAWHGDFPARYMPRAFVATVSVGAPRRLLVRPKGGGRSIAFTLGWGDLFVMGGTAQRTHEHAIPKVASAEPRIVIMYRPLWIDPRKDARAAGGDALTAPER